MKAWALAGALAATLPELPAIQGTAVAAPLAPAPETSAEVGDLLDYLGGHGATGFMVIAGDKVLIDQRWAPPKDGGMFANFIYGHAADGALLEDVASQQKSFVAVLVAIAIDRGLIDPAKPVSAYLGQGWSKASPAQEALIRVDDVLTMSSGLDERFAYVAPAGTVFFYNTPVYATTKRILAAAAGRPLEAITEEWLTAPVGMADTAWRQRPAALASVGNATGLVTTPRDIARFGSMVLHGGVAENGRRVVSKASLDALFVRSAVNPAYGRLWWLNGGDYKIRPLTGRAEGPLIPAAPADTVAALGALDRRLYVSPSRQLVVVRTGAETKDPDFDQQLWLRLAKVLDKQPPATARPGQEASR